MTFRLCGPRCWPISKSSELGKWLSGQHNFTIKALSMLSSFFGEPLVSVH